MSEASHRRRHRALLLWGIALAIIAVLGGAWLFRAEREKVNVVLVTMDTTRADHISHLGYSRPTTPNLDLIAAQGITFTRAYSTSSWTAPAHASIFTSLLPSQHGCHMDPGGNEGDVRPLRTDVTTLAELLKKEGFVTGGFVGGPYLSSAFGFGKGFDVYDDQLRGRQRPAREVNEKALAWLANSTEKPFFLFVNYFDPHGPYQPDRRVRYPFGKAPRHDTGGYKSFSPGVHKRERKPMPSDEKSVATIIERYDQEIYAADHALGQLITSLRQMGVWNRTLLVITSDHGEGFGERIFGRVAVWGHGHAPPYHPQCHVPLVIRLPHDKGHGRTVTTTVSNADIFTTVTSYLSIARPPDTHGTDLLSEHQKESSRQDTMAMAERYTTNLYTAAFWTGGLELIEMAPLSGGASEAFHDLRSGPGPRFAFAQGSVPARLDASAREALRRMRADWTTYRNRRGIVPDTTARHGDGGKPVVGPALREKLKALGYTE